MRVIATSANASCVFCTTRFFILAGLRDRLRDRLRVELLLLLLLFFLLCLLLRGDDDLEDDDDDDELEEDDVSLRRCRDGFSSDLIRSLLPLISGGGFSSSSSEDRAIGGAARFSFNLSLLSCSCLSRFKRFSSSFLFFFSEDSSHF